MSVLNKIRWAAAILLVFLIVLTTNLIDKDNYHKLKESVTTIYEDRIVAGDILFEMSMLIHEKEMAIATSDSLFFTTRNMHVNNELKVFTDQYRETKLTENEKDIFKTFNAELNRLFDLEINYAGEENKKTEEMLESLDEIVANLRDLSKVQLDEGKRQMLLSNRTMSTIELFTQAEILFLIVLGVLIQFIILYNPRK